MPVMLCCCPGKQVYVEGYSRPKSNLALLDSIIATRHATATEMEARSYAHWKVRSSWGAVFNWQGCGGSAPLEAAGAKLMLPSRAHPA